MSREDLKIKNMKTLKLKVHSVVSLITNSSTELYTFYDGCIEPLKELIDEFLKLSGVDKKCDDLFVINVFLNDFDDYGEFIPDDVDSLIDDIQEGKVEKPQWMFDREEENERGNCLYITRKDDKYRFLVEKLYKFIISPTTTVSYE